MAEIVKEIKKVEKEVVKEEKKVARFFSKRENIWMTVSAVLLIALIVVLAMPHGISKATAGKNIVNYLNTEVVQGGGVTLKDVQAKGDLYEVTVVYQGKDIPVYITKDGKYYISPGAAVEMKPSSSTPSEDNSAPKDIPKTAKPVVEAFVFSYCPYGLQFEKALLPVYRLLGNKTDINIVAIGAMHGDFEKTESLRQIAIQQLYGKDKLWDYLSYFMANTTIGDGNCRQDVKCSDSITNAIMAKIGIDKVKVNTFMTTKSEAIYEAQNARAAELGISGSPDFVINGVEIQSGRSPEAVKTLVCSAFTNAPAECSQALSTAQASAWFGSDAGGNAPAGSCG